MTKSKQWLGVRHLQVLLIFLGQTTSFTGRVTISIAIVAMTDPNNENYFNWSIQRQSVILSSFAWGYVILQGASGELASKFGGMNLMILSVGVNSIVSLLLPVAAIYGGWMVVCGCRLIQGLLQGLMFPALHYLIGKWVPVNERSQMASFIISGAQFGTGAQLIVSGYIAEYWGWPAIFYVNGVVGLVWVVAYLLVGSDNPQISKLISDEERFHIQSSLGQIGGHKRLRTPWKAILTSIPFIATVITNTGFTWGYWTLLTEIPTYMSKVLNVDIKSVSSDRQYFFYAYLTLQLVTSRWHLSFYV
ncbi:putative inorganic phosphate cotransporter [Epargyreus clarus]|uniref:putative inorganic phosphate cotransporter n=1 Tax=Epargyreus clarus TaxID=520877 RepID=UPI003C2EF198